jgi:hypothetical protein
MLKVHLVGLIKENKLIKMHGVSNPPSCEAISSSHNPRILLIVVTRDTPNMKKQYEYTSVFGK